MVIFDLLWIDVKLSITHVFGITTESRYATPLDKIIVLYY